MILYLSALLHPLSKYKEIKEKKKMGLIEYLIKQNLILKNSIAISCQSLCNYIEKVKQIFDIIQNKEWLSKTLGIIIRDLKECWPLLWILCDAIFPDRRKDIKKIIQYIEDKKLVHFFKEKCVIRVSEL